MAHGEYTPWLESIGMSRTSAYRFIRVYDELDANRDAYQGVGVNLLFEIATLPHRQREQRHVIPSTGESKDVKCMTVKEIREVKKVKIRREQPKVKRDLIESGNNSCSICGYDCTPILHLHHIKDVQFGGDNSPENVTLLCPNCHAIVHSFMSDKAEKEYGLDFLVHWINTNLPQHGIQKLRELWEKRIA